MRAYRSEWRDGNEAFVRQSIGEIADRPRTGMLRGIEKWSRGLKQCQTNGVNWSIIAWPSMMVITVSI